MQPLRAAIFNFAFLSERRKIANISVRNWVQLLLMGLTGVWLWLQFWSLAAGTAACILILNFMYTYAKRARYTTFSPILSDGAFEGPPLAPDEKLAIQGTGRFFSGQKESQLLMAAGELWLQPVGTLAIMLEPAPGLYKYQFVEPKRVEKATLGEVSFAGTKLPAIDLNFSSNWALNDDLFTSDQEALGEAGYKKQTIMLMFNDLDSARRVFDLLV